jgi:hypothetical protein
VFKNRILREYFDLKGVTGGWRKLHDDELDNLYCMPDIIKMTDQMGCSGHSI